MELLPNNLIDNTPGKNYNENNKFDITQKEVTEGGQR